MKGDERKGEEKEKKEKEKKRISDRGVKRQHSTIENVQRIRDFLEDAREVLKEERVPVRMWKQQSAAHHGGDSGGGGYVGGGRTIGVTFGLGSQPPTQEETSRFVEETWLEDGAGTAVASTTTTVLTK